MTQQQMLLFDWLCFYDWVTGPDGPSPRPDNWKEIVNDDAALDDFLDNWQRSHTKDSNKQNTKGMTIG